MQYNQALTTTTREHARALRWQLLNHLVVASNVYPQKNVFYSWTFSESVRGFFFSHILTLAHRNSSKLSQYFTLLPFLLSGEFKENRIINFWDNWPRSKKFTDFRILYCVLTHISTLAHRNSFKRLQYVTLVPILLSGEFKENSIINKTYTEVRWTVQKRTPKSDSCFIQLNI